MSIWKMERRTKIREFVWVRCVPPNNSGVNVVDGDNVRDILLVDVNGWCLTSLQSSLMVKRLEVSRRLLVYCLSFELPLPSQLFPFPFETCDWLKACPSSRQTCLQNHSPVWKKPVGYQQRQMQLRERPLIHTSLFNFLGVFI